MEILELNPPPADNRPEYSVSDIAGAIKNVVENNFGYVRVRGELSGVKFHTNGHCYFSLKDEKSVLNAVCWKGTVGKLKHRPADGIEMLSSGRVTTYPGRSQYQLVVDWMEPAGAGALMQMLEALKKKLAAEGLFNPDRRKALPYLPEVIGVVTSPTGAVIRDILNTLAYRCPRRVLLWPVAVQGDGAKEQIAAAIQGFNALDSSGLPRPDVLIVARGGGSMEDLWAFNEEIVIRAAAASVIPLISAVGHETDTTLIDHVSDRRASTPTQAAQFAVPVRLELLAWLEDMHARSLSGLYRGFDGQRQRLEGMARGLPKPEHLLDAAQQRLDDWSERLSNTLPVLVKTRADALAKCMASLQPQRLQERLALEAQRIAQWQERLAHVLARVCEREKQNIALQSQKLEPLRDRLMQGLRLTGQRHRDRLEGLSRLLENLNYHSVLKRGFTLVRGADGKLITSAGLVKTGARLQVEWHDGSVVVAAEGRVKQMQLFPE